MSLTSLRKYFTQIVVFIFVGLGKNWEEGSQYSPKASFSLQTSHALPAILPHPSFPQYPQDINRRQESLRRKSPGTSVTSSFPHVACDAVNLRRRSLLLSSWVLQAEKRTQPNRDAGTCSATPPPKQEGGVLQEVRLLLQSPLGVVVPDRGAVTEAAGCVRFGLHPPPAPAA